MRVDLFWLFEEVILCRPKQQQSDTRDPQDIAVEYNDTVIYPDKVWLNCYYYRHYSFVKDIQMLFCTVLGKKMEYAGERI
jgi:lipopolysaccharide/colanic/teichoic acid biosynthesis glycosyltransferase